MTDNAAVEAVVRRYLARLARRWSPLAVVGVVLLLVLTLVSPTDKSKDTVASGNDAGTTRSTSAGARAGDAPAGSGATDAGALSSSAAGASGGAAGDTSGGGGIESPAPQVGAAGAARSGVACGPTVRQVPWSVYAPICQPKFEGSNGGATSHGVTATTITGAFRRTNSAEEKAAFAALGDAAPGTDDQYLSDLRAYFDLFNSNFELYGRKLVVKDFNGQGDNLEEDQGRNLQGAQADAATARNIGAFMDLSSSPTLASTQPYEENLAHEKVVAIGAVGLPQEWFKKYAPYEWSITPTGTQAIDASIHAFCQRGFGLPASDAGDPTYKNRTRTFGVVLPENPEYKQLGDELEQGVLKECGAKFTKRIEYSINVATEEQQSVSIIAQMHAANVTSVACICDPVVEVFLSHAADQQKYGPEWSPVPWLDPQGRTVNQAQAYAIAGQWLYFPPQAQSEAYRAFKLARPTQEPAEKYYIEAYWTAVYVFTVLQNAGPNLTPQTFAQGAFGMTKSGRGMFGTWEGGPDKFSPTTEAQVGYWDQNAVSNMDGKKGAWVPCEGGKWFSLTDPGTWAPAHTQMKCR